jgi:hypothetical protein
MRAGERRAAITIRTSVRGALDHQFLGQHLMLRYLGQDGSTARPVNTSTGAAGDRQSDALPATEPIGRRRVTSAIGSTFVNEARAQYAENEESEAAPSAPAIAVCEPGQLRGPGRFEHLSVRIVCDAAPSAVGFGLASRTPASVQGWHRTGSSVIATP